LRRSAPVVSVVSVISVISRYLLRHLRRLRRKLPECPFCLVFSGGLRAQKSGGLSPRLPRPLSTGPVAPARRTPCALAAHTEREAASARRTARTLQGDLLGRGTSPTGCACPWRRQLACDPEPTEIFGRGSLWPAPRQHAAL